ncbi:hypothetical protein OEZ85_009282 [Tetradesmus obliquus]|uniref:Uncharacterized protein n=1 Tax=Tetradesmus obliquus TaxID=3088 RepID=A0ABY8U8H3_TETOB|nr:hypothetical protein OEZ85_009282 [Tetradesmus obliquus]
MRGKLPQQQRQYLSEQQLQQLGAAFGNFFASVILEDALPGSSSLGELAVQLRAAVDRGIQLWLPDLSWASSVMGISHAALTGDECNQQQQQPQQAEDLSGALPPSSAGAAAAAAAAAHEGKQQQQQQQVTWRRLHAMGPRCLLQQQMQLGLLASLSTTQWPLDYAADASFAGQLPLLAVPSFSQPQPYPLLLMQQGPPGMGGGLLLHVWLDAAEVPLLQQAVAARGGL